MTCSSAAVEPTSDSALPIRAKLSEDPNIVGTWVARLIAAPLNQRATTSEWTALNDFEELEMKRYVILPFPHSSEARWGPRGFWGKWGQKETCRLWRRQVGRGGADGE